MISQYFTRQIVSFLVYTLQWQSDMNGASWRRRRSRLLRSRFCAARQSQRSGWQTDRNTRAQRRFQRAVSANQLNPSQKHPPRSRNLLLVSLSLMLGWNFEQPSNHGVSGCSQLTQPVGARSLAGRQRLVVGNL